MTILGFTAALPTQPKSNNSANLPTGPAVNASSQNQQSPQSVGANNLPNLSLPKTVLSSVNSLVSSGGVIETSPSDLTLYNLGVAIHLLGGALPHDELLARDHSVVSSHSLWSVNVQVAGLWTPMVPASNNFTILGTNSSGTFVIRTMKVDSGVYSGTLRVTYRATSEGSLKWDLAFDAATSGHYKLVYDLWNLTSSIDHTAGRILSANLGRENYTLEWGDVPRSLNTTTSVSIGRFSLHIDLGRVMTGSTARVDPGIVGSSSSSEATGFSFQRKVFYEQREDTTLPSTTTAT